MDLRTLAIVFEFTSEAPRGHTVKNLRDAYGGSKEPSRAVKSRQEPREVVSSCQKTPAVTGESLASRWQVAGSPPPLSQFLIFSFGRLGEHRLHGDASSEMREFMQAIQPVLEQRGHDHLQSITIRSNVSFMACLTRSVQKRVLSLS